MSDKDDENKSVYSDILTLGSFDKDAKVVFLDLECENDLYFTFHPRKYTPKCCYE